MFAIFHFLVLSMCPRALAEDAPSFGLFNAPAPPPAVDAPTVPIPATEPAPAVAPEVAAPTPATAVAVEAAGVAVAEAESAPTVLLGFDVVPGLGTSSVYQGRETRIFSFNLIGGLTGGLKGVQLGEVFNLVQGDIEGVDLAGVFSLAGGNLEGSQWSGAVNVVGGDADGLQAAGAVNVAGADVKGAQWAGAVNVAGAGVDGAQISGALNIAGEAVHGVQISGAANLAGADVKGAQIGVVNIAGGTIHGVQVGVVNLASDNDGFAIGLVNLYSNGRTHLDSWMDESGQLHAGLEHGGSHFHNIYALGANPFRGGEYSFTLGYGLHFAPGVLHLDDGGTREVLFLDMEGLATQIWLSPDASWAQMNLVATGRAQVGLRVASGLALTVGPTYNFLFTTCEAPRGRTVLDLGREDGVGFYAWPGVTAGIKLFH